MRASDFLDTLTYEGNSREMVKTIVQAAPALFRGRLLSEIAKHIRGRGVTVVTEAMVFEAVREFAPRGSEERYLSKLEPLRSDR